MLFTFRWTWRLFPFQTSYKWFELKKVLIFKSSRYSKFKFNFPLGLFFALFRGWNTTSHATKGQVTSPEGCNRDEKCKKLRISSCMLGGPLSGRVRSEPDSKFYPASHRKHSRPVAREGDRTRTENRSENPQPRKNYTRRSISWLTVNFRLISGSFSVKNPF